MYLLTPPLSRFIPFCLIFCLVSCSFTEEDETYNSLISLRSQNSNQFEISVTRFNQPLLSLLFSEEFSDIDRTSSTHHLSLTVKNISSENEEASNLLILGFDDSLKLADNLQFLYELSLPTLAPGIEEGPISVYSGTVFNQQFIPFGPKRIQVFRYASEDTVQHIFEGRFEVFTSDTLPDSFGTFWGVINDENRFEFIFSPSNPIQKLIGIVDNAGVQVAEIRLKGVEEPQKFVTDSIISFQNIPHSENPSIRFNSTPNSSSNIKSISLAFE